MRKGVRSLALAAQIPVARATMQTSSTSGVGAIDIRGKNVGCVVAGLHPRFDACMFDPNQLGQARVFFRAASTDYWFRDHGRCARRQCGVLDGHAAEDQEGHGGPGHRGLHRDHGQAPGCQPDPALPGEGGCQGERLRSEEAHRASVPKASVVVGSTPGAPAALFGFVGGGISSTTIALGTLGVAGLGGGVHAARSGGGGTTPSAPVPPPAPPSTPPTPTDTVTRPRRRQCLPRPSQRSARFFRPRCHLTMGISASTST